MDDVKVPTDAPPRRRFWSSPKGAAVSALVAIAALLVGALSFTRDVTNFTITAVNQEGYISTDIPRDLQLPVSRCFTLTGEASSGDNAVLWVAHTEAGASEFFFWPTERILPDSTRWSADMLIGSETGGSRMYDIWVFFLPTDVSEFVTSLSATADGPAYWFARNLPLGVGSKPTLSVSTSDNPNEGC
jgi:hypothetical protein